MHTSVLTSDDPKWAAALDGLKHDFYHRPDYVHLEAQRMGGQARAVVVEEQGVRVFLPTVLVPVPGHLARHARDTTFDAISPYGYPSVLIAGVDAEAIGHCVDAAKEALASAGVCTLFVRLHPLLDLPLPVLSKRGALVEHGETVWVNLNLSREELWRETRRSDKNRLNKMRRMGWIARVDPTWDCFEAFLRIYEETMRHVGAAEWYFFDRSYFERLRRVLGGALHLCVVEIEGQVVAAGLFTECNGVVQFHLSGTASGKRAGSPSRLMVDHMRWWSKERGNTAFHLGGGVGAAVDSLSEFKCGFSRHRARFRTWRVVLDPDAYSGLRAGWQQHAGLSDSDVREIRHFPLHRYRGT